METEKKIKFVTTTSNLRMIQFKLVEYLNGGIRLIATDCANHEASTILEIFPDKGIALWTHVLDCLGLPLSPHNRAALVYTKADPEEVFQSGAKAAREAEEEEEEEEEEDDFGEPEDEDDEDDPPTVSPDTRGFDEDDADENDEEIED